MIDLAQPPATQSYLNYFENTVLNPVFKNEHGGIYSIPKSGTHSLIKYCLAYPQTEFLKQNIATVSFMYIELGESQEYDFWQNLYETADMQLVSGSPKTGTFKSRALATLTSILPKTERIIIFLGNFREAVSNPVLLQKIIEVYNTNSVQFVLVPLITEYSPENVQALLKLGLHTNHYIRLRSAQDIEILLQNEQKRYSKELAKSDRETIVKLSGGYSALARSLLSVLTAGGDLTSELITAQLLMLYGAVSGTDRQKFKHIVIGRIPQNRFSDFCEQTGLVEKREQTYEPFSQLFKDFILRLIKQDGFFTFNHEKILRLGIDIANILGPQEFLVAKLLAENQGNLITKDEIAKAMWGNTWDQNFSAWAIDKLMSRLRSKLGDFDKDFIKTVSGKGFVFENEK